MAEDRRRLEGGHEVNAPSPFFADQPTLQYAWDNTSLSMLQTCPYKYYLTIIEGWKAKSGSVHLVFGGHYAKAMERFFKFRAEGMEYDDALDEVIRLTLEETWVGREYYDLDDHMGLAAGWPAPILDTGAPWESNDSKKNRETLVRSIVWYFEEYADDSCQTLHLADGSPAVELSFVLESGIKAPDGSDYILTGHLDRLVEFGGDKFVMDQKTTGGALGSYYFSAYDLDNQMSQYTFAGRIGFDTPVSGVIIDAAQIMVGFTAFGRGITMRSQGQLEEWHQNSEAWLHLAERFSAEEKWPQNRMSCNNYGGCVFKNICNKDPAVRQLFLETDFKKEFWNPLEVR
jgi:hypothetical protein